MNPAFLNDDDMRIVKERIENGSRDSLLARLYTEVVVRRTQEKLPEPVPMLLWCPECGARHVDVGEFATKAHHTHACQHCGHVWRPAIGPTCGVQFLPGFKNEEPR